MLLQVDVENSADLAVVTAAGEIDASTVDLLGSVVSTALTEGVRRVLVDFSHVTFIDSTGLGLLVRSHRDAVASSATFAVVHPTASTRKLIRVLGLDQLLNVYDSTEQALADAQ